MTRARQFAAKIKAGKWHENGQVGIEGGYKDEGLKDKSGKPKRPSSQPRVITEERDMKRGTTARRAKRASVKRAREADLIVSEQPELQELAGCLDDMASIALKLSKEASRLDPYERNVKSSGPFRSPVGKKYKNLAAGALKNLASAVDQGKLKTAASALSNLSRELDRVAWE